MNYWWPDLNHIFSPLDLIEVFENFISCRTIDRKNTVKKDGYLPANPGHILQTPMVPTLMY